MKYECCACRKDFPVEDAVDGFQQGYPVGFLCPLCGANLQDNLIDTQPVIRKHKGVYLTLITAGVITDAAVRFFDLEWRIAAPLILGLLLFAGSVYWRYPTLRESIVSTRLGPGRRES